MEYISINTVLQRILRDDLFKGISIDLAIDSCIDFFELVEVPAMFESKMVQGTIENNRCIIPKDLIEIKQFLIESIPIRSSTDTLGGFESQLSMIPNLGGTVKNRFNNSKDITFSVKGNYIYTSCKKGDYTLVYSAIPTDVETGFPLIPNDRVFIQAFQNYLELKFIRILWRNNKVSDRVYEDARQEYYYSVGQYETHARRLDLSSAESFFNMFSTLIPRRNEFKNRFRNLGAQEQIKKH